MAKKRKGLKRKPARRRGSRRRVGAINSELLQTAVGVMAGNIVGPIAVAAIAKAFPSVSGNILKYGGAAVQGIAGYALAKRGRSLTRGVGVGLMASAGRTLVSTVVPGIGAAPVLIPARSNAMVGDWMNVPRLAGTAGRVNATPNGSFPRPSTVGNVSHLSAAYAAG